MYFLSHGSFMTVRLNLIYADTWAMRLTGRSMSPIWLKVTTFSDAAISRLVLSIQKITKQINSKSSLLILKYGNLPPSREPWRRFLPQSHSKTYSMYLVQARVLLISTSPMITLDTVRYKLGFGNDMYFS